VCTKHTKHSTLNKTAVSEPHTCQLNTLAPLSTVGCIHPPPPTDHMLRCSMDTVYPISPHPPFFIHHPRAPTHFFIHHSCWIYVLKHSLPICYATDRDTIILTQSMMTLATLGCSNISMQGTPGHSSAGNSFMALKHQTSDCVVSLVQCWHGDKHNISQIE